jgi:SH3-like domain-containing protein
MRQTILFGLLILSFQFAQFAAQAVPVYLKPESRFATGNQARSKLESRTKKSQIQRWFRVKTKDRSYGWLAEDHALTALKLVEQATVNDDVPARSVPDMSLVFVRPVLPRSTPVMILEIQGSWARVQPLTEQEFPQSWVPTEKLTANFATNIAQRAFVYQTSLMYVDADKKSRALLKIDEGTYVQLIRAKGNWLEIRSDRYQGYVSKANVWTAHDLGEKGVRAAIALAPLRSAPLPYAELIRSLPFSSTLTLQATSTLRWGLASTREQGDVWWPMTDEHAAAKEVASFERMERT